MLCHVCKRVGAEKVAALWFRGERSFVFVHEDCLESHLHRMAVEAYLNISPEMRHGLSFQQWREEYGF